MLFLAINIKADVVAKNGRFFSLHVVFKCACVHVCVGNDFNGQTAFGWRLCAAAITVIYIIIPKIRIIAAASERPTKKPPKSNKEETEHHD